MGYLLKGSEQRIKYALKSDLLRPYSETALCTPPVRRRESQNLNIGSGAESFTRMSFRLWRHRSRRGDTSTQASTSYRRSRGLSIAVCSAIIYGLRPKFCRNTYPNNHEVHANSLWNGDKY